MSIANGPPSPDAPPKPLSAARAARWIPPLQHLLLSGVLVCAGMIIWWFNLLGDHQNDKLALLVCAFLAVMLYVGWFAFRSGRRGWSRWMPGLGVLLALALPFAFGRIREVGGELWPHWSWRWAPDPDETLALPAAPSAARRTATADLATTTPDDFPQFLGPNRDLHVRHVRLARDWKALPPKRLWSIRIGAGWSGFAAVNGFAVTMEQRGEQELVSCYDLKTGELKWHHGINARYETVLGGVGPRCTPAIDQGRVYALGATGVLRCLDGATGELLWKRDLMQEFGVRPEDVDGTVRYGRANSPLVAGNLVIIPAGGPSREAAWALVAYDKAAGREVWRGGKGEQVAYASPALATLAGVEQVLSVNEMSVTGHDPATGHVLWRHPRPGHSAFESNNSQPLAVGEDRVLLTKGYGLGGELIKVRRAPGGQWSVEEVWKNKRALKTKFTNVVVHQGYIYGLDDGILQCVALATGRVEWKKGRYHHGQVLAAADVLLVVKELTGEVVMVELTPQAHRELAKFQALESDKVWNNLCLYGRHLLVRDAQTAACWELPLAEP